MFEFIFGLMLGCLLMGGIALLGLYSARKWRAWGEGYKSAFDSIVEEINERGCSSVCSSKIKKPETPMDMGG